MSILSGGFLVVGTSSPVIPPVVNNILGVASITGTGVEGQTLTAVLSDADGITSSTPAYQWRRSGVDISGATSSSYLLTSTDVGETIAVAINYTDDGSNVESIESAPTQSILPLVVSTTSISEQLFLANNQSKTTSEVQ